MGRVSLKSLGRSSLVASLAEVWRIVSRFILTPIIIGKLGLAGYGAWTVLFSIAAQVSAFNLSFGIAYSKYTAEHVRKGTLDELAEIIGAGMLSIGSIAVLAFGAGVVFHEPLLHALKVPPEHLEGAGHALTIILGLLVLRMTVGAAFEILSGLQRIDIAYRLNIFASVLEFAVSVSLLIRGGGVLALAIGYATGQIVSTALAVLAVKKEAPGLSMSPFRATRRGFGLVFGLGGRFQILSLVVIAASEGVKLILSALLGTAALAVYDLADKLLRLGQSFTYAVLAPLMPAFADLHAGNDTQGFRALLLSGSKVVSIVSAIPFVGLAVLADAILVVWTAEVVPEAAFTIRVLVLGEFITQLTGVGTSSLRAQGKVGLELGYALVGTALLVATIPLLFGTFGYEGVVFARAVAALGGSLFFLARFSRSQGLDLLAYLRGSGVGPVLVATLVPGTAILAVHTVFPDFGPAAFAPRFRRLFEVAVLGLPYAVAAVAIAFRFVLSAEEREKALGVVRRKLGVRAATAP